MALFTQVFADSEGEAEGRLIGDLVSNLIATTDKDDLFGFKQIGEDIIKAPLKLSQPIGWLAQSLTEVPITPMSGTSRCVKALDDQKYW